MWEKEIAVPSRHNKPTVEKITTLANETQIGESESAAEIYLCLKVLISAPFIKALTADCKWARGNSVEVCTFSAHKTAAWENGIVRGEWALELLLADSAKPGRGDCAHLILFNTESTQA